MPADYVPPAETVELSADDKAAAEKQGICPVTGEKLFGHGTPVKVTVRIEPCSCAASRARKL